MSMKILLIGIMVFFSITVFGETGAERIKFSFEEKEIVVQQKVCWNSCH